MFSPSSRQTDEAQRGDDAPAVRFNERTADGIRVTWKSAQKQEISSCDVT